MIIQKQNELSFRWWEHKIIRVGLHRPYCSLTFNLWAKRSIKLLYMNQDLKLLAFSF